MTNLLNPDNRTPKTGVLPFEPGALDRSGLRLTRAEFARFLGCSKQAVGEWVTAGKITLGADGRLDPRQAVNQLIRNTDPARVRARVLQPLTRDLGRLQQRVSDLEAKLANALEDCSFHEGASQELVEQFDTLGRCLRHEADGLAQLPAANVIAAILAWLELAAEGAVPPAILGCAPSEHAPGKAGEGAGNA